MTSGLNNMCIEVKSYSNCEQYYRKETNHRKRSRMFKNFYTKCVNFFLKTIKKNHH